MGQEKAESRGISKSEEANKSEDKGKVREERVEERFSYIIIQPNPNILKIIGLCRFRPLRRD
jgi:hypothetical protein